MKKCCRWFVLSLLVLQLGHGLARAEGTLESPVPVRTVAPDFPAEMKNAGVSGLVSISCLIDEKGNVQDARVEKTSHEAFGPPALEAVSKWKFKPARRDGNVIAVRINVPVKFTNLNGAAP